jgi:hypothetical protein
MVSIMRVNQFNNTYRHKPTLITELLRKLNKNTILQLWIKKKRVAVLG